MEELREGQVVVPNPYVAQADKLAASLKHLADTFLIQGGTRGQLTEEEMQGIFEKVSDKVCESCTQREQCLENNREQVYHLVYELMQTVEEYGAELNVEMKRKLQKQCILAPRFLRKTLEGFQEAKQVLAWNNKMALNRKGCAVQLDTFAQLIRHATRELNSSIFSDTPLEKKIKMQLKRSGVRMLSSVFFVSAQGRYEIHVTVKAEKGICVTTKALARILSGCTGKRMLPADEERPVVGQDYCTIVCVEGPGYHTLQGMAKIGKGCQKISGDSFLMTPLPGGRQAAILSDGMGSGESAFRESAMVVEMLEELLKAGFPQRTALSMINTALVMGREEICFSTADMAILNLYDGSCDFFKAGAAPTFIRREDKIEHIYSQSLPLGVVQNQEPEETQIKLYSGDTIVMVTDGVLDALPSGEQENILDTIIQEAVLENPEELAHYILQSVLEHSGDEPQDDMTVLVASLWASVQ